MKIPHFAALGKGSGYFNRTPTGCAFGLPPVSGDALLQTQVFSRTYRLEEKILDGFRYWPVIPSGKRNQTLFDGQGFVLSHMTPVPILLVDRRSDAILEQVCQWARGLKHLSEWERLCTIADKVNALLTRDPNYKQTVDVYPKQAMALGKAIQYGAGNCAYQSLLFKILADEAGLNALLQVGKHIDLPPAISHLWDEVCISDNSAPNGKTDWLVDAPNRAVCRKGSIQALLYTPFKSA